MPLIMSYRKLDIFEETSLINLIGFGVSDLQKNPVDVCGRDPVVNLVLVQRNPSGYDLNHDNQAIQRRQLTLNFYTHLNNFP